MVMSITNICRKTNYLYLIVVLPLGERELTRNYSVQFFDRFDKSPTNVMKNSTLTDSDPFKNVSGVYLKVIELS